MYIPSHFLENNQTEIIAFMQRFNFGTIITAVDDVPTATHLPFAVSSVGDSIVLRAHFAKANPHWKHVETNQNLIVFNEPHAYISPGNYEKKEQVPTWNYLAVHAYGVGKLITKTADVFALLEEMMLVSEPEYIKQWNTLSSDYKHKMANGIVAFEIEVKRLEAKKKLSQNKTENERRNIYNSLSESDNFASKTLAEYMAPNSKK